MSKARSAAVLVVLLFVACVLLSGDISGSRPPSTASKTQTDSHLAVKLDGTLITTPDGTQVVLQRAENPKGTVLMFHGCSHSATDFFPKGPSCSSCIGLPEELHIVRKCLARGLSIVALSSNDRQKKCWHSNRVEPQGPDYDRVENALKEAARHGAFDKSKPLFSVGASSGGVFATSLLPRFSQLVASNAIVAASACAHEKSSSLALHPHVFTHMGVRDTRTAGQVRQAVDRLKDAGFAALDLLVEPIPITHEFLSAAFPNWDSGLVHDVHKAIKEGGLLGRNGHLVEDPRRSKWRSVVQRLASRMNDSLIADKSPLSEELNRAWSEHEQTADRFDETLDFFFAQLRK